MEKNQDFTRNGLVFHITTDSRRIPHKKLVVPFPFRVEILSLCHEGVSTHLSASKAKDEALWYYYWCNVVREMQKYVNLCDHCQSVRNEGEENEVPLELVPKARLLFFQICQRCQPGKDNPQKDMVKGKRLNVLKNQGKLFYINCFILFLFVHKLFSIFL